jgi:class 3 adenylate cyclase/DNA-binding response OmpR family regulator
VARETVLVVDDGQDNRDFLVEYVLKPNGYEHMLAVDGQDGLMKALKHRPDLILLDLQMPRMNGIEVLEHLNEQGADIPVILMTFHGSEEIAVEVYRMGVKDYVIKPYYPEEMLESIESALAETRLRREKEELTTRVLQANRELQRRVKELKILYSVGKSVTSVMNMEELLPHIVESAVRITGAEEGVLCLIEDRKLICRAHRNQKMKHAKSADFEVKDPLPIHAIRTRQPVTLSGEQLQNAPMTQRPNSVCYTPLLLGDRILGVLGVANFTPQSTHFTENDSALLSALSDYASIAIENSRNYSALHASKEHLQDTFERFVAPSVVQQALTRPEGVQLGGQRQEISVLFADIRGYTSWSENAAPEQVVETLNHYLSLAAGVVIGWQGTLDKFFGDGLMAIFNAPDPQADHVHRATDAAIAIMRAAEEVNLIHGHQLSYSIGVHVGEAVVGYIGSQDALNYTAIGDTVNLAKRLQEYAAPGQILVDESVVKRLGNLIHARPMGELKVKGRKTPSTAYQLIDLKARE